MPRKTEQLRLLDVHDTSPKCLSAERMSSRLAKELVETIYLGDFELTRWQSEFLQDMYSHYHHFSLPQRKVIYSLARKCKIL